MRRRTPWLLLALVAALLAGCAAAPVRPPPVQTLRLGLHRAEFRDYRGHDPCGAEPRWLSEELRSPLALLGRFVTAGEGDPDGAWTKEALDLLTEGAEALPPLIEVVEANLSLVRRCSFADTPVFQAILKDGPARCAQARRLLPYVPELLDYRRAHQAREQWRSERVRRGVEARRRCEWAGKGLRVEHWVVECDGSQEWVFCDGARLTQRKPSDEPQWQPPFAQVLSPAERRKKKRVRPPGRDDYLAAARAFTEADRCPRLPERPSPSSVERAPERRSRR